MKRTITKNNCNVDKDFSDAVSALQEKWHDLDRTNSAVGEKLLEFSRDFFTLNKTSIDKDDEDKIYSDFLETEIDEKLFNTKSKVLTKSLRSKYLLIGQFAKEYLLPNKSDIPPYRDHLYAISQIIKDQKWSKMDFENNIKNHIISKEMTYEEINAIRNDMNVSKKNKKQARSTLYTTSLNMKFISIEDMGEILKLLNYDVDFIVSLEHKEECYSRLSEEIKKKLSKKIDDSIGQKSSNYYRLKNKKRNKNKYN